MGGKKLIEEREPGEKEGEGEPGEGEKEFYQTVQINLDSKGGVAGIGPLSGQRPPAGAAGR
jgi:hypothetical protein